MVDMFYKVDFIVGVNTYNTYDTWGIIPYRKPIVNPPNMSKNGELLNAGSNTWQFLLLEEPAYTGANETYLTYLDICDKLNGKQCGIKLYYSETNTASYKEYSGTVNVTGFVTEHNKSTITLSVSLLSSDDATKKNTFAQSKSITFAIGNSTYNTYTDWHLTPVGIPIVNPPKARTNYVSTPAANGAVDLTEVFGAVYYDNAQGDWYFEVLDGYYDIASSIFSSVVGAINGKAGTARLLNNTGTSYTGRFEIPNISISDDKGKITISYNVEPW